MASPFNSGFVWDPRYIVSAAVGNGAFGTVWRAVERESGEPCAIKRVALDERDQTRELSMMQQLSHENVVRLRNWFSTNEGDCTWLHLVMDFMPCTLRSLQARILQQQRGFPPLLLKILMWQLLQALRYLPAAGIAPQGCRSVAVQGVAVADRSAIIAQLRTLALARALGDWRSALPLLALRERCATIEDGLRALRSALAAEQALRLLRQRVLGHARRSVAHELVDRRARAARGRSGAPPARRRARCDCAADGARLGHGFCAFGRPP